MPDLTPLPLTDEALDRLAEVNPDTMGEGGEDRESAEQWARQNLTARGANLLDAEVTDAR